MKQKKTFCVLIIALLISNLYLLYGGGYIEKALFKFGLAEYRQPYNWSIFSWRSSLQSMNIDADIVFFGDSIVCGGCWANFFPDKKIVNLGISGDTIYGMSDRIEMISAVRPEKIFICGGINSLTRFNVKLVVKQYKNMVQKIRNAVPNAEIYVQSVLPVSKTREKWADNDTINLFNSELKKIAEDQGITYINVHDLYTINGELNPELTKDGVHLKINAYSIWAEAIKGFIKQ